MNYRIFEEDPELMDEFKNLCSNSFIFVDTWEDDNIQPTTMRLYSKMIQVKEASRQFMTSTRRQVTNSNCVE